MQSSCKEEVLRIHEFFVNWLNGTDVLGNSDTVFDEQCGAVLANDLVFITTEGKVIRHDALFQKLRQAYASKKGQCFNMEIHQLQVLQHDSNDDAAPCLVMYQEWHYHGQQEDKDSSTLVLNDKRQCTALFRRKPNTPCGVEWVHIHETSIVE